MFDWTIVVTGTANYVEAPNYSNLPEVFSPRPCIFSRNKYFALFFSYGRHYGYLIVGNSVLVETAGVSITSSSVFQINSLISDQFFTSPHCQNKRFQVSSLFGSLEVMPAHFCLCYFAPTPACFLCSSQLVTTFYFACVG